MKSRGRQSKLRALGFQVSQPTDLQTHLFRAEAALDAMLIKLQQCYAANPTRFGFMLHDNGAATHHQMALQHFETAQDEIRLAVSAASAKVAS